MIGSLRGTVIDRSPPGQVLVEVAGVGYLCTVSAALCAECEPGAAVFLYVHHHFREDLQTLYAFRTRQERDTFNVLLSAHGIGPAMAISLLSIYSPTALVNIVATADTAALTVVPGIGKKTAERVMVELKSRLDLDVASGPLGDGEVQSATSDVREALTSLGYGSEEIREVMRQLDAAADKATMLRDALAILGARRAG